MKLKVFFIFFLFYFYSFQAREIGKFYLPSYANPKLKSDLASNIFLTIETNDFEKFEKILSSESLNQKNKKGATPLIYAVQFLRIKMVDLLLDKKAEVLTLDKSGRDAIFYAASSLNFQIVEMLLAKDALSLRTYGKNKESVLADPVRAGDIKLVKLLITKNPKILFVKNAAGETVLFEAARFGVSEIADYLLSQGLELNSKNRKGQTVSDIAKSRNYSHLLEVFAKYK